MHKFKGWRSRAGLHLPALLHGAKSSIAVPFASAAARRRALSQGTTTADAYSCGAANGPPIGVPEGSAGTGGLRLDAHQGIDRAPGEVDDEARRDHPHQGVDLFGFT